MSLKEKLNRIQTQLKAPKNLRNTFGNYNYRNLEGIFEAVKPYLNKEGCILNVSDEVVEVGGRVYLKATAILSDIESNDIAKSFGYAREAESKKGMDASQLTGTASSYARKYAMNGLLLIDDTKDADTDEHKKEADARAKKEQEEKERQNKAAKEKIDKTKADALTARCQECEDAEKVMSVILELYSVESLLSLNNLQYANINANWDKIVMRANE